MNATNDFAVTIGLDWADQKHDLWLRPADGSKAQHLRLEQTPEVLHEWIAQLRERVNNRPVAIGVETSRGPVISAFLAYDFIVLFPINPKALKDYRAAFSVSGAKDDRTDAQLLEEMVRLHRDKLKAWQPDTELTRKLGGLTLNRRNLVNERTRLVNQAHATLKTYYPLAETLVGKQMNKALAAELLARWPDLESLQKADPKTVRAFFYKHNCRNTKKIEERLDAIKKAKPLTTDPAIIVPARLLIVTLAGMLKVLHQSIARLDQEIQQAMDQHPDAPIFRSFPGAGPALAPRLLVAYGTDRERFASADEVAQLYGMAPVVVQSGNSKIVHMRYRCPKFGRQTFHENAGCALKVDPWVRCYYEEKKSENGGHHHQACRAVSYKLNRVYFACWKHREKYDAARYLKALKKSGSPLHKKVENLKQVPCE
jgi:transposase